MLFTQKFSKKCYLLSKVLFTREKCYLIKKILKKCYLVKKIIKNIYLLKKFQKKYYLQQKSAIITENHYLLEKSVIY